MPQPLSIVLPAAMCLIRLHRPALLRAEILPFLAQLGHFGVWPQRGYLQQCFVLVKLEDCGNMKRHSSRARTESATVPGARIYRTIAYR